MAANRKLTSLGEDLSLQVGLLLICSGKRLIKLNRFKGSKNTVNAGLFAQIAPEFTIVLDRLYLLSWSD